MLVDGGEKRFNSRRIRNKSGIKINISWACMQGVFFQRPFNFLM